MYEPVLLLLEILSHFFYPELALVSIRTEDFSFLNIINLKISWGLRSQNLDEKG
ncbi:hypothetical protein LEP1GSC111_2779 [Leptospira interrogans str. UT126]|nr:hypothetical protein LEP1GSC111_2779 [Leptospira interrogans str. UT126]